MSQARRASPQTLPRLRGAALAKRDAPRTYNAAEARTAAAAAATVPAPSATAAYTGTAALRRIYAPSPPVMASSGDLRSKGRGRSPVVSPPPPAALAVATAPSTRGQAHHLAPLDTQLSAQQRYATDATRFLAALEESQRTALKFEERRYRLHVYKSSIAHARVAAATADALPPLFAEDAEVPRAGAAAEVDPAAALRPPREDVAGALVDDTFAVALAQRRARLTEAATLPQLTATEAQLPTLTTDDACAPTHASDLRRLRLALAGSLLDEWWPGMMTAAATRKAAARTRDEAPVLRAVSVAEPHTPPQQRHSDEDELRRVRAATAAEWVAELLASTPTPVRHMPLRFSEEEAPRAVSGAQTALRAEEVEEARKEMESDHARDGALWQARHDEASAWVHEAMERHSAAHASTVHAEVEEEPASPLRSSDVELPRFVSYAAESPRSADRDLRTSGAAPQTDDAALRRARREEAAKWVHGALHEDRAVTMKSSEKLLSVEEEIPILRSFLSELPRLRASSEEAPLRIAAHPSQANNKDDALRRARRAEATSLVCDALHRRDDVRSAAPAEVAVMPLRSAEAEPPRFVAYAAEAPQPLVREPQIVSSGDDGLHEARVREASAWVAEALSQHRLAGQEATDRDPSALPVLTSFVNEPPRQAAEKNVSKEVAVTTQEQDDNLRRVRCAVAGALVDDALRQSRRKLSQAAAPRLRSSEHCEPRLFATTAELPKSPAAADAAAALRLKHTRRSLAREIVQDAITSTGVTAAPTQSPLNANRSIEAFNTTSNAVRPHSGNRPTSPPPLLPQQEHTTASLRQTRLQVARALVDSLEYSTPETNFNVHISERGLFSDTVASHAGRSLRTSLTAATAQAMHRPQPPSQQPSDALYAARRALAQKLVHDSEFAHQTVLPEGVQRPVASFSSLRAARLHVAGVMVDTLM